MTRDEAATRERRTRRREHRAEKTGGRRARRERDTTRVQLELQEPSMERLQRLKERTESASYAEVIKNAMRLYEALIDEVEAGNELALKDKKGKVTAYRIFV